MFGDLENEYEKIYENMVVFCYSKDWKIVERIYIIPWKEIEYRKTIAIVKDPSKGVQWYKKYRMTDKDELNKANEIWTRILEKL